MDIKKELEPLVRYIKDKVIAGDYRIIKLGVFTATISIDAYEFEIWIGNDQPMHFKIWTVFPLLPELNNFTEAEQIEGWNNLHYYIEANERKLNTKRRLDLLAELASLEDKENG